LLRQAWGLLVLAALGAVLAAPARAQGPDPAPTRAKAPRPDPAPTHRLEAPSSRLKQTPVRQQVVHPPAPPAPAGPPPVAPQRSFSPAPEPPAPVRQARVQTPRKAKPAAAKPQRAEAPLKKRAVKRALGAIRPIAKAAEASPDGMLLAGGIALFFLSLGEAIFLALSVRFLRGTSA
jgi:hypothetical protein